MKINQTVIQVVRGSVIDQPVDAIVNAANTSMQGGGGVDGAIHRAAGRGLIQELRQAAPHGAKTGTAVLTGGHNLKQPWIIHTPGPVWHGGKKGEADLLASCYRSCLELAAAQSVHSIAFCSISTGVYGYPITQAAPLAVQTVVQYLKDHPETTLELVIFAMFGADEYTAFHKALEESHPYSQVNFPLP